MKNVQAEIEKYLIDRGWDSLVPADLAKSIMIEGAELLELFQWKNHSPDEIKHDKQLELKIRQEMADVMIYCTELAIRLGIDIENAMREKLEHNSQKYPVAEMLKDKGKQAE